jgi:predicted RNA-binding Zn ribbon-like protein
MSVRRDPFEWSGGHPALDLVNTLDERPSDSPIENLATYRDLLRFTELAGLIERSVAMRLLHVDRCACARVVKRARTLREHLHGVLAAAHTGRPVLQLDLNAISIAVQAAHATRVLVASPEQGLVKHRWTSPLAPDVPLHACSLAIERLLIDADRKKIRKCGAFDCDVYYVDTSKCQLRQWCSMKGCGNREKQRRWRSTAL